jgi:hypothetical protein
VALPQSSNNLLCSKSDVTSSKWEGRWIFFTMGVMSLLCVIQQVLIHDITTVPYFRCISTVNPLGVGFDFQILDTMGNFLVSIQHALMGGLPHYTIFVRGKKNEKYEIVSNNGFQEYLWEDSSKTGPSTSNLSSSTCSLVSTSLLLVTGLVPTSPS